MSELQFTKVVERLCLLRSESPGVEVDVPLDDDGYLDSSVEPLADTSRLLAGALVRPADVVRLGALVLLGEPGVGKTTTFSAIASSEDTVWVSASDVVDDTFDVLIGRHLSALPDLDTTPAERPVTIVIDQIDESPMVPRLAGAIRRGLIGRDASRLRLLLGCRTADYPESIWRGT